MIETLQRFVQTLRTMGVRVSPAEAIDAALAVQAVGVEPRELFRSALKSCLCKTRRDAPRFDRAFDQYFSAPPDRGPERSTRHGEAGAGGSNPMSRAAAGRRVPPTEDPDAPPGGARPPAAPTSQDAEPRRRDGRLRLLVGHPDRARGPGPRRNGLRPEPRAAGKPVLAKQSPATRGRSTSRPGPRVQAGSSHRSRAHAPELSDPKRADLSAPLTTAQELAVAREVPRIVRQIRLRAGRRLGAARAGRLWTSRLLRDNVGTEGVPFTIPYRARRPRRPRIVLLVDVSWSVMSASTLFLVMAREFLGRSARITIHFFVDRCVEVTDRVSRWKGPAHMPLARLLEQIPGLDPRAASDYGRAFFQALRAGRSSLGGGGRDTVLVILGDARSNGRDPQAWAFEDLASRCRRVIWLNPEPAGRWNTGDSDLSSYLTACDVLCEARDLEGLARGVEEIAKNR